MVFLDAGSSINLIYTKTLRAMNISLTNLTPSDIGFHSIVLGKPEIPMGRIMLEVIFGTPANFRKEKIEFEVIDWPSQYHAILG
jgi:trimethylamine:corrinoid methyltransferase-like protein